MRSQNGHIPKAVPTSWLVKAQGVAQAYRNTPRAFGLVVKCGPGVTLAMTALTLVPALLPAAQAWVAKLIVDGVVAAIQQDLPAAEGFRHVAPYLGLEFGLIFAGMLIGQVRSLVEHVLHARLTIMSTRSSSTRRWRWTFDTLRTGSSTTSCRMRVGMRTLGRCGWSWIALPWCKGW